MIVGDGEPPPHSMVNNKNSESNERVQVSTNVVDDEDLLLSQAYDQFLTQTTSYHQRNLLPGDEDCRSSSGFAHEKEPEKYMDENTENIPSGSHSVNYLEDLITLEDLVEPIRSTFNDNSDEYHNIDIQELDNDLSDASYVACITMVEIFKQSWNIITSKPQLNDSGEIAASVLTEVFDRAWRVIKPKSRWRVPDPGSWTRNVAIKRRAEGLPYVTGKKCRQAKIPKAIDCSKCKYKCGENFSAHDRETLCRIYWAQSFTAKKNMILNSIKVNPIKTTTLVRKRSTLRANTKQYFFKKKSENHQVCQNFFCKTLCISPSVITEAVKNQGGLGYYTKDDLRGYHEPPNKSAPEVREEIRNHIKKFPTMESHYLRKQTKRQYLDCKLSISKMYELYVEMCQEKNITPVSESLYRKVFCTEFNLGFFIPKKDQCLLCTKFSRLTDLNDVEKAKYDKLQDEYQQHIKRKEICNEEKERDKQRAHEESNFISATFDLQAILQIPSCDVGLLYYSRKLIVYNLTIYESAYPNEAYCFAWTEINGKKGSSEIGSILLHYLSELPEHVREVSLFSDTCGGQNRNQYVAAVMLWAVFNIEHLSMIEHKFLESGHSHMEADSMHSSIESAQKHTNVFSMTEWLNTFRRARSSLRSTKKNKGQTKKPYNVKEMKYGDFKDLKLLAEHLMTNRTKNTEGQQVQWLKIKRMRYVKSECKIFYNYDMTETFFAIEIGKKKQKSISRKRHYDTRNSSKAKDVVESVALSTSDDSCFPAKLESLYKNPLYISTAEKADLLKLCEQGVVPEEYHPWFQSLQADGKKVDRTPDVTVSDESEYEPDSSENESDV